jgi:hypothetical protein
VPQPAVSRCRNVKPKLLDHFVGAGEQHGRNVNAAWPSAD